jgi:hypothetical protein
VVSEVGMHIQHLWNECEDLPNGRTKFYGTARHYLELYSYKYIWRCSINSKDPFSEFALARKECFSPSGSLIKTWTSL